MHLVARLVGAKNRKKYPKKSKGIYDLQSLNNKL